MSRSRNTPAAGCLQPPLSQPARKKKEKEPIPDLWEVPGTRLPGNPSYTRHEPEFTYVTDVRGNRVCVIESRVVRFNADSAGIKQIRKLRRPQSAKDLWAGPTHHILTHALRLLQVCTVAIEGGRERGSHEKKLRPNISPTQLLRQTGLSPEATSEVLRFLENARLLRSQAYLRETCYYVDIQIKGFGPQGQKYQAGDLIDGWALPEDDNDTESVHTDQGDLVATNQEIKENRHEALTKTYEVSVGYVSEQPAFEDGYAVFTTPAPLPELVADQLSIGLSQARRLLEELVILGVYRSRLAAPGEWLRYIKLGEGPFTEAHVEQVRAAHRQALARRRPAQPTGQGSSGLSQRGL